jgi:DNA-binding MarR family transcriptional regulator
VPREQAPARIERRRARKLVAAAEAAREVQGDGLSVAEHLREREAGELEAFEQALGLAAEATAAAFRTYDGWIDGLRAGLVALLGFFDEEPVLARYLVVDSAQAGPAVAARRREVLERVAALLDDERAPARAFPPPLTAHAVASGVLGVLHARLSEPEPGALVELVGSLMSFTVMPFLGARAARRELGRASEAVPSSGVAVDVGLMQDPGRRLSHHREIEVLGVLACESGLSNTQVAQRADVKDGGQASRLLGRLARLGLIENTAAPTRSGMRAWRLTRAGERLHAEVRQETQTSTGALVDLPGEYAGRLDFWAVCVLRAVAEQPWLTSGELAARVGVDPVQSTRLLGLLSELGLVDCARESRRQGTPKVWQVTHAGRELDNTTGLEAPARRRSAALELMSQSGGRLSERAIAVLRVAAGEPGLSNGEIAHRVGIGDANSMSQLLSRLVGRALIENRRDGGRENAWVLTAAGTELQNAIREEAPAAVRQEASGAAPRTVASDALKEAGGRLNHRVASVLNAIGAEPGLSNLEIAERVGVASKAHTSKLLARLVRFGLIENQAVDSAPFQANAWRLTASGRQLHANLQHAGKSDTRRPSRKGQSTNAAVGCL